MWLTKDKSQEVQAELREEIERALRARGLSARQLSLEITGHDGLIRDLRAGRVLGVDRVAAIAEALGLEFYFGPRRETGVVQVIDSEADYAHLPLYAAQVSAGKGRLNDSEEIVDVLAFKRAWLKKIGVDPAKAAIVRASGDSMEPSILDGDLLLVDLAKTEPPSLAKMRITNRRGPIFALCDDGEAKVKRVYRADEGTSVLYSDNADFPPTFAKNDTLRIIGKVMWWGHTNREL